MSYVIIHIDGGYNVVSNHGGTEIIPCLDLPEAESKCNYLNGGDGLTKRERFAMAAMQGIQASVSSGDNMTVEYIADVAIKQADSLIKALEGES